MEPKEMRWNSDRNKNVSTKLFYEALDLIGLHRGGLSEQFIDSTVENERNILLRSDACEDSKYSLLFVGFVFNLDFYKTDEMTRFSLGTEQVRRSILVFVHRHFLAWVDDDVEISSNL